MDLFRSEVFEARRQRLYGDVVLTQPLSSWLIGGLLIGILVLISVWILVGRYSRIETAPGFVVPQKALVSIQAPRPGTVMELNISEGDAVHVGQVLALISTEQTLATGSSAASENLASLSTQSALNREQMALEHQRQDVERSKLQGMLAQLGTELEQLQQQIGLQKELVASTKTTFDDLTPLAQSGHISKVEYARLQQAYLAAEQQARQLQQQRAALTSKQAETRAELTQLSVVSAREEATLNSTQQTLLQRQTQINNERSYTITAPIDGRVTAVQTAAGRFVDGHLPMLTIVPLDSPLEVEVFAPSRAIGFVQPGQEVRLRYDAFPYQRFGSFGGRVVAISRTVIGPQELDAPLHITEPVYRIRVALDAQSVSAFGKPIPLQPGMTLTASLVLDKRKFIDWILEPLDAVRRRA